MTIKGVCEIAKDFTSVVTVKDAYHFALLNSPNWFGLYDLEEELIELAEDYKKYSGEELVKDFVKGD